ncbi:MULTISPECIES: hypothetical protein [unclassified Rhizobium]|jgi:hypothetical protein|uniref:hypothetical protein n=1 Tax=unclassified Rhizobium TaxID=2613769 RepID=UPI000647C0F1|nr:MULTISPECIES: hypothetical protein [unclassified Rhizobium]OJY72103.1 MAG: hypothetical protein BGP09_25535 [Rhizobium sp. 60-20]RKD36045.1 hypothetical protein BJ928_12523 [Rhizobium sp. WW_1]
MKFEAEIDDAQIDALVASIGDQLKGDPTKRTLLAAFALEQVLGWMSGRAVHQSLTEQHTDWLTELLPIFYPDDIPSTVRIFNNFKVPYGRAAYISRVLLEKQQTSWRQKGRANLLAALKLKQAEAQGNIGKGDALKYVPVSLDNISYRELTVIVEELFRDDPTLAPPVNKSVSPGRRTIDIPSQLFPKLIAKLGA